MTPDAIARLRHSLDAMHAAPRDIAARFYGHLFAIAPQLRPLFVTDLGVQQAKFADMLLALVAVLDQPAARDALFAGIGRRHAGYGVLEAHYDAVGAALLRCLREQAGTAWDEDLETAWASFYGELAEAMIAAAHGNAAPAPG